MASTTTGGGAYGSKVKKWVLFDKENLEEIEGQFIPQNMTRELSGNIAEVSSVNRQYPILQWVGGVNETYTFTARLWAKDSTDNTVGEKLQRLEKLVVRNRDLGRPPVCAFYWGDDPSLAADVLVQSLGGITYDEIMPPVKNDRGVPISLLRGVTLQITLRRFVEVDLKLTDPSEKERQTRIRRARKGDTYESIALDEYGDPSLGILLRQLNPRIPGMDVSDLTVLDPVHAFDESFLLTKQIQPEFLALRSGSENEAAEQMRRDLFELRNKDVFTTVFSDTAKSTF